MNKRIEAEGNELVLSSGGSTAIIPKNKREEVLGYLNKGNHSAISDLVSKLPMHKNYAEDGTTIPDDPPVGEVVNENTAIIKNRQIQSNYKRKGNYDYSGYPAEAARATALESEEPNYIWQDSVYVSETGKTVKDYDAYVIEGSSPVKDNGVAKKQEERAKLKPWIKDAIEAREDELRLRREAAERTGIIEKEEEAAKAAQVNKEEAVAKANKAANDVIAAAQEAIATRRANLKLKEEAIAKADAETKVKEAAKLKEEAAKIAEDEAKVTEDIRLKEEAAKIAEDKRIKEAARLKEEEDKLAEDKRIKDKEVKDTPPMFDLQKAIVERNDFIKAHEQSYRPVELDDVTPKGKEPAEYTPEERKKRADWLRKNMPEPQTIKVTSKKAEVKVDEDIKTKVAAKPEPLTPDEEEQVAVVKSGLSPAATSLLEDKIYKEYRKKNKLTEDADITDAEKTKIFDSYVKLVVTDASIGGQVAEATGEAIDEYAPLVVNGVTRAWNKLVAHDEPVSPYVQLATGNTDNETFPRIKSELIDVADYKSHNLSEAKYTTGVMDLNNTTFGVRNRGEVVEGVKQVGPRGFNPFQPASSVDGFGKKGDDGKSVNNPDGTYIGIDANGKFKTGNLDEFDADDMLVKTSGNWFTDFRRDENGNILLEDDKFHANKNPGNLVPTFDGFNDDLTPITTSKNGGLGGSLNLLSRPGASDQYGGIYGGAVIVKDSAGRMQLISGSLINIDEGIKAFKTGTKDKYIKVITVDNGSFGRQLRSTREGGMNASDFISYDKQNVGGGNMLYVKDYTNRTPEQQAEIDTEVKTKTTAIFKKVLTPHMKDVYTKKFGKDYIKELAKLNTPDKVQPKGQKFKQYHIPTEGIRNEQDASYAGGHPLKQTPNGAILHYTAYNKGEVLESGVLNQLISRNVHGAASAHMVIDKDGTRYKLAEPDDVTFHAGYSYSEKYDRENMNDFTIGIEFQGDTTRGEPLTDAQISSFIEYIRPIIVEYNIPIENVLTHTQIRDAYIKKYTTDKKDANGIMRHYNENDTRIDNKPDMAAEQADIVRGRLTQKIY